MEIILQVDQEISLHESSCESAVRIKFENESAENRLFLATEMLGRYKNKPQQAKLIAQ